MINKPAIAKNAKGINPDKVLLWENTRKEIRESLKSGNLKAAIIPTGSTEQHSEHLALCTDIAMATFVSQQVALQLYPKVTVSTPCPVGYSPYHMARKGTLSIRKETFKAYVFDIAESLAAHGINNILVINGHGGNGGLLEDSVGEWRQKLGVTMEVLSYWSMLSTEAHEKYLQSYQDARDGKLNEVEKSALSHASEFETSLLMAAYPERVRSITMEEYDDAKLNYAQSNLSSEVISYYKRHYSEEEWPERIEAEHNGRDRARHQQALLGTPEKGQELLDLLTYRIGQKIENMIETTESGAD